MKREIWTTRILAGLFCLAISAQLLAQDGQAPQPRFRVEARLEPQPETRTGPRFELRADLRPHPARSAQESAGLSLKAVLSPSGDPLCPIPGQIFGDGFESP